MARDRNRPGGRGAGSTPRRSGGMAAASPSSSRGGRLPAPHPPAQSADTFSQRGKAQEVRPALAPDELETALDRFDRERDVPRPGGTMPAAESFADRIRQNSRSAGDVYGPQGEPPQGPIGKAEVQEAARLLGEYRKGKQNLDNRIVDNEKWFKLHNALTAAGGVGENAATTDRTGHQEEKPDSAWLFNSLMNKHADAMDNYPEPNVLPRAADDVETARQVSSVLPVILEQNHYQELWDKKWWYKLKHGFSVMMVTWNPRAAGGLGDISITRQDVLNLAWEPGISDIQQSKNLFCVQLMDIDTVHELWPWTRDATPDSGSYVTKYYYDETVDTTRKCSVVDWWYKKAGRVHYCKFVGDVVIFASENDPRYAQRGYYDHGLYPFIVDNMFPVEGSPVGFGYIDLMKGTQGMIDSLRRATVDHAVAASMLRWFVREDGGVNEQEYADLNNHFVHMTGSLGENDIRPIEVPALDGICVTMLNNLVDEMKETSGNRDFAQGGTSNGITAASAIAALQEAGSKPARDMLNASYRAFEKECELCIELMRQFYTTRRYFRITGENGEGEQFVSFDNSGLRMQPYEQAFGMSVTASRKNAFSALSQNELAKELYGMGVFDPANADRALAVLSMMTFEGKDKVVKMVQDNGTLYQRVQMLQDELVKVGYIVDATTGTLMTPDMVQSFAEQNAAAGTPAPAVKSRTAGTNMLGRAVSGNDQATRARRNAMMAAAPGGQRQ